jgi:hypothetical protein
MLCSWDGQDQRTSLVDEHAGGPTRFSGCTSISSARNKGKEVMWCLMLKAFSDAIFRRYRDAGSRKAAVVGRNGEVRMWKVKRICMCKWFEDENNRPPKST